MQMPQTSVLCKKHTMAHEHPFVALSEVQVIVVEMPLSETPVMLAINHTVVVTPSFSHLQTTTDSSCCIPLADITIIFFCFWVSH